MSEAIDRVSISVAAGGACARPRPAPQMRAWTVWPSFGSDRTSMVRHVLAIYRATAAGDEVARRAHAVVVEHGARLTVGVMAGRPSRPGGCGVSGGCWDAMMREEAERELERARRVLGSTAAHLMVIEGSGSEAMYARP